ncbi:MAG: DNA polymerase type-B [Cenarchaeum symbiont of Oopsacas minuta]|nr:DNA polymerase type-B [Cenarchaeum symbiont of Oopsacas minuta]
MSQTVSKYEKTIPPSILVSAAYDGVEKIAVLKFYDPNKQRLLLWRDESGHKPYCYSKLSRDELSSLDEREDIISIDKSIRKDLLEDKDIEISKIIVADPLVIGGTQTDKSIRNTMDTWESDIKYYENYLYDAKLVVGKYYSIQNGKISPHEIEVSDKVRESLKTLLWDKVTSDNIVDYDEFKRYTSEWANLLNLPIPFMRRLSFDIEVESEIGRIPDPKLAEKIVTAIGFAGNDGMQQVFVLRTKDHLEGQKRVPDGVKVVFYDEEKKLLEDSFAIIQDYPFVLTYNGDDFDMPYLYNRAKRLGIPDTENPFHMLRDSATLNVGVHIDLYRTFSNRSFQIYAFSAKYTDFSLNSVTKALLGEQKIDYGVPLDKLELHQLAHYCYNDARITLALTTFNNDVLMNLLIIIARIGRMPMDDIARMGVSQWIRSLLYYEHRQRNAIIPRRDELEKRSSSVINAAVIKDKKYRGGLVVEPKQGIHFDVTVMDFASLYPSIIKVKNLSYETVRCSHKECKANSIPDTNHWACTKKNGITSLLIGSLRDLRVNYYKSLSKNQSLTEDQRQQYTVISQALKVILNASYGVMGAEIFPLYFLPVAEATTAVGRHIIVQTIKKCEDSDITVLYGDTDSLFIKNPSSEQIITVIEGAKKDHGVELEVDKEYRYVVLSGRKKNYLGVTKKGKVDVKGLTGKKSHTPPFIKKLFYELLDVLANVHDENNFVMAKKSIMEKITVWVEKLEARKIPLKDLAFHVMLSKSPDEYVKTIPQHIRAAKQLEGGSQSDGITSYSQHTRVAKHIGGGDKKLKKGDIVSYVKVNTSIGVKPVELAKLSEIDNKKYIEFIESTLDQITSSLGIDFDEILGKPKQVGLEEFFY